MIRVLQTLALPLGHVAGKPTDGKRLDVIQPSAISHLQKRAGNGIRTRDLLLGKEVFYQLNYARETGLTIGQECREPESNWRHHDFQSCALPTELSRPKRWYSFTKAPLFYLHVGRLSSTDYRRSTIRSETSIHADCVCAKKPYPKRPSGVKAAYWLSIHNTNPKEPSGETGVSNTAW